MSKTRPYQPRTIDELPEDVSQEFKKEKSMDIEHVRHLLQKLSQEALDLAKNLRDSGPPLNAREKGIIKMVKFEYLQEALREASMMWFMDDHDSFIKVMDRLWRDVTD